MQNEITTLAANLVYAIQSGSTTIAQQDSVLSSITMPDTKLGNIINSIKAARDTQLDPGSLSAEAAGMPDIATMLILKGVPASIASDVVALYSDTEVNINNKCTSIAKLVLANTNGKGYDKLYREQRKGAKYMNGWTICFYGAPEGTHDILNTIFEALSMNAVAITTGPGVWIDGRKLRITHKS